MKTATIEVFHVFGTKSTTGYYDSVYRKHKEKNMNKKWKAINKVTGEPWEPSSDKDQFLVMYDTGVVDVVTDAGWDGYRFEPLDMTKYYILYKTKLVGVAFASKR